METGSRAIFSVPTRSGSVPESQHTTHQNYNRLQLPLLAPKNDWSCPVRYSLPAARSCPVHPAWHQSGPNRWHRLPEMHADSGLLTVALQLRSNHMECHIAHHYGYIWLHNHRKQHLEVVQDESQAAPDHLKPQW